ncbi:MAG: hypothetical protein HYZ01_02520 [Ignavibacteriales bacterium]|nr:hypothetical protein [Ignavibacteriales bacterium]
MIWLPLRFTRFPHTDLFRSTYPTQGRTLFFSLILISTSLSFSTCDEFLPAYSEPDAVLEATLSTQYVLDITDNSLKVYLTARNVFDETLQAKADVTGTIELESLRDPSVRKAFLLSAANFIEAPGYNRNTGILTINPHQSVRLGVSWNFVTDDAGRDIRREFFKYIEDPTCEDRCFALTEDWVVRGRVQLFEKTGSSVADSIQYALCFVNQYVRSGPEGGCASFDTNAPCNLRPPVLGNFCTPQRFQEGR